MSWWIVVQSFLRVAKGMNVARGGSALMCNTCSFSQSGAAANAATAKKFSRPARRSDDDK